MLQEHPDNVKSDTEDGSDAGGVPRALVDRTDFDGMAFFGVNELDPATRECFFMLGVLAEGTIAPADMLSNLWNQVRQHRDRTMRTPGVPSSCKSSTTAQSGK